MKAHAEILSKHDEYIMMAINQIKKLQLAEAKKNIMMAIDENVESPDSYNLLGIIWEYLHDTQKATKFYRVAYNFDPTFEPASKNLDRVTNFFKCSISDADFGDIKNCIENNKYFMI